MNIFLHLNGYHLMGFCIDLFNRILFEVTTNNIVQDGNCPITNMAKIGLGLLEDHTIVIDRFCWVLQ